jgi:hypothetical protein
MELVCCVWIVEETAIFALHNIKVLFFITGVEIVYCAARTAFFYKTDTLVFKRLNSFTVVYMF